MTYARSILAPPGSPGTYHCVSRCLRRTWLCGERTTRDSRVSDFSYGGAGRFLAALTQAPAGSVHMTYVRSILVPPGSPGTYHCVSRCVRRALSVRRGSSVKTVARAQAPVGRRSNRRTGGHLRRRDLGYAMMSNHLHVVEEVIPQASEKWSAEEVAGRWLKLYSRQDQDTTKRAETLSGNEERIAVLRNRLCDLSWFMRCLAEPIARRANREGGCKGHFMSMDGRYAGFAGAKTGLGSEIQVSDTAGLDGSFVGDHIRRTWTCGAAGAGCARAAFDLNPVRAKICDNLEDSAHTSARTRLRNIDQDPGQGGSQLAPVLGLRGFSVLTIRQRDYRELVDHTGRQIRRASMR